MLCVHIHIHTYMLLLMGWDSEWLLKNNKAFWLTYKQVSSSATSLLLFINEDFCCLVTISKLTQRPLVTRVISLFCPRFVMSHIDSP